MLVVVINFAACPNYYLDTHPDYCLVSGSNSLQHALTTIAPCCIIMVANLAIFLRVCLVLLRQRQMPGVRRDSDDRPRVTWAQVRPRVAARLEPTPPAAHCGTEDRSTCPGDKDKSA